MILGNKSDLEKKVVTKEMGMEYAARNKVMFMETSAKKDIDVSTAFERLAEKLIDTKLYFLRFSKSVGQIKQKHLQKKSPLLFHGE